VPTSEQQSQH